MRIIEKVEISKFRSIGDRESFEAKDLNIISGSNDSGKSNFLKALNLFFNSETDLERKYSSEDDFNKWFRDNNESGQRNIEISITVASGKYGDKEGINNGFQAKKVFGAVGGQAIYFYRTDGQEITNQDPSYRKASSLIYEKIKFIYIPAIRDVRFRELVQRRIEEIVNTADERRSAGRELRNKFTAVGTEIKNELTYLTNAAKEELGIDLDVKISFSTLLESLEFQTSEQITIRKKGRAKPQIQTIKLRNRGDGIQMQFFSLLLWFVSKQDTKHRYLWGYEEPEIAFEFKRQLKLAELFAKKFAQSAQIFVTTHSPAFAFLNEAENSNTNVFRVRYEKEKKKGRSFSRISLTNQCYEDLFEELDGASKENKKLLEEEIWGLNYGKISNMLGQHFDAIIGERHISHRELRIYKEKIEEANKEIGSLEKTKETLRNKLEEAETEIKKSRPSKIFICEDESLIKLWEDLMRKSDVKEVKVFSSYGKDKDHFENTITAQTDLIRDYHPLIFRQYDRDGLTEDQANKLELLIAEKFKKLKNYKPKFLPVCEMENFLVLKKQQEGQDFSRTEEERDKLEDKLRGKIKGIVELAKNFAKGDEWKIFNSAEAFMIKEARISREKYFPGKEILTIKTPRLKASNLKQYEYDKFPQELKDYLNEIKKFFDKKSSN